MLKRFSAFLISIIFCAIILYSSPLIAQTSLEKNFQEKRHEQITEILKKYKEKKIKLAEARKLLKPIIEDRTQDYLKNIDQNIQNVQSRIEILEAEKKNLTKLSKAQYTIKKIENKIKTTKGILQTLQNNKINPQKFIDSEIDDILGQITP